jgi:regulation of enolase protein 1 (concanavalin A-like superfamily)
VTSFNAPIIYKRLPLTAFSRARTTVSAEFKTLYDQGGLVLVINPEAGPGKSQWVKTGIEWYQGKAFVSTVCCDKFADWSLSSSGIKTTTSTPPNSSSSAGKETSVTLEIEKDPKGGALWIYVVDGKERLPVREVTWVLDVDAETECWIGVYAATPIMEGRAKGDAGGLVVGFEGWVLETK